MARRPVSMAILGLGMAAALGGCERIGSPIDALTQKRAGPDEFNVLARRPLRMPGTTALPVPQPGARSPLEPDPNRAAIAALLGEDPGITSAEQSTGELDLLTAANAAAAEPEIRQQLEADRTTSDPGEYKAPTIFALVLGDGSTVEPGEILDPNTEARRLQTEGLAPAPINPDDRPDAEPLPPGTIGGTFTPQPGGSN